MLSADLREVRVPLESMVCVSAGWDGGAEAEPRVQGESTELKNTVRGCAQLVECSPSMHRTLGLTVSVHTLVLGTSRSARTSCR